MTTQLLVELPETLSLKVSAVASARGETVSSLIQEALAEYISELDEEAADTKAVRAIETRLAEGRERLYSHQEIWDELDSSEPQRGLPDQLH